MRKGREIGMRMAEWAREALHEGRVFVTCLSNERKTQSTSKDNQDIVAIVSSMFASIVANRSCFVELRFTCETTRCFVSNGNVHVMIWIREITADVISFYKNNWRRKIV